MLATPLLKHEFSSSSRDIRSSNASIVRIIRSWVISILEKAATISESDMFTYFLLTVQCYAKDNDNQTSPNAKNEI